MGATSKWQIENVQKNYDKTSNLGLPGYPVNYHLFQANPYLIIYLIVKKLGFL